jgi:hypothetical protein
MTGANGNGEPDDGAVDPVEWVQAQMLAVARQIEAQFMGCEVSIFIADPNKPEQFNHVTTAPADHERATLQAFLKEQK